jgi:pilus assembly protein Flp/PilA
VADKAGATAVEYGLMIALIFLMILGSVASFGTKASGMFTNLGTIIGAAIP